MENRSPVWVWSVTVDGKVRLSQGPATKWRICEKCYTKDRFANLLQLFRAKLAVSMLNKIANCAYKTHADWLNHFYSPWKSKGYKVENLNGQLHLDWNLIWTRLEAVIIADQETIAIHENQIISGNYKMKSGWIYLRIATSWVWLQAKSQRTISNDSLTRNRTLIWHQLRSCVDHGHVTSGIP